MTSGVEYQYFWVYKEIVMFLEMEDCHADKNWAIFYKTKGFKNWNYQKMSKVKVILLI